MVKVSISTEGFDDVFQRLEEMDSKGYLCRKSTERIAEEVAKVGVWAASAGFQSAYQERGPVECDAIKVKDGWKIVASGDEVAFIEFGAGVYYNGFGCYPMPRPYGIVTIGEYGKHHGLENGWWYYDSEGKKHYTHGTPCAMPMYKALKQMKEAVIEAARKEFAK